MNYYDENDPYIRQRPNRPPFGQEPENDSIPFYQQPGTGRPPYYQQPGTDRPPYYQQPGPGRPPYYQQPGVGRPPFNQQPGPGRPPAGPPSSTPSDAPTAPPPSFEPVQSPGLYKIDPGAIRPCTYQYVYLWLENGRSFWAWLTYVGRRSVAGYRWNGFRWIYFGTDTDNIQSFQCY